MAHFSGKKIAKSHSTIIDEAKKILTFASSNNLVKKIVTGEIKPIKSGPIRLKISPIDAGLKLMIRGRNARQQTYIYTDEKEIISKEIQKIWDKYYS